MTNLTDAEYIKKAMLLAKGFHCVGVGGLIGHMDFEDVNFPFHVQFDLSAPPKHILSALAFQLRDQLEATDSHTNLHTGRWYDGQFKPYTKITALPSIISSNHVVVSEVDGNTALDWIKCIVDSGLLGGGE